MEIAALVFFIFLVAIVMMIVSIPLLIISKLTRLLKNSYAKLFHRQPKKA